MNDMFGLYDDGKIPKESMFDVLEVIKSGTYCCDGNIGETMEYVTNNRCIECLKDKRRDDLVLIDRIYDALGEDELTEELEDYLMKYGDYSVCKECLKPRLIAVGISEERAEQLMEDAKPERGYGGW
jgi:hypothetical protein